MVVYFSCEFCGGMASSRVQHLCFAPHGLAKADDAIGHHSVTVDSHDCDRSRFELSERLPSLQRLIAAIAMHNDPMLLTQSMHCSVSLIRPVIDFRR